ncbi:MAG: hypothetical protein HXS48_20690 [Theionarchaea archaeon]|nr:hypothetical protein [Theionarchaea archaeon]
MIEWNYFKTLSIAYGLTMIGKGPVIHLLGEKWTTFELNRAYTEKQPLWVWIVGTLGIFLVIITWYMYFTTYVKYSSIIMLIITLTMVKVSQVLFNYERFREFAVRITTEDTSALSAMNFATAIGGVILVLLGIFVY